MVDPDTHPVTPLLKIIVDKIVSEYLEELEKEQKEDGDKDPEPCDEE